MIKEESTGGESAKGKFTATWQAKLRVLQSQIATVPRREARDRQ